MKTPTIFEFDTRWFTAVPLCFAVAVAAIGCASAAAEDVVRGTVTYRERMALPPEAVLEISLQDVSLADAPARELASVRLQNLGNPPFGFEIAFDGDAIDQRSTYAVRATIHAGGELLFTTDTSYPVLTRGAGNEADMVLRLVPAEYLPPESSPLGGLPATFEGELPCADCPGIFYHLDLFEDRVFFLRMTYLGRGAGAIRDSVGTWVFGGDDQRLALFGGAEGPVFFRVVDRDTIRKLDVEGRDIQSELDYDLRRKDDIGTIEPRLNMRGMYQYMADAALFTECLTGRRFPVATEGENIALERAYLEARREPGEQILVSLSGRIAARPKMEGEGLELVVVPERFGGVWPGETCGVRRTRAELLDTYWKLTRLGTEAVIVGEGRREPHLVLRSEDSRVTGFSGCNRLNGGFSLDGSSIELTQMASTMMACADGAETERRFLAALGTVKSWRLLGHHLDLFDDAGNMVARFEARYLK